MVTLMVMMVTLDVVSLEPYMVRVASGRVALVSVVSGLGASGRRSLPFFDLH